jgi:DNA segregation ATPase FtsK/SpoIIIE-like protein
MHLVLATQDPRAEVVTGLIKANMPCKVCFKVGSVTNSRIVLDGKGGELLLGKGDMMVVPNGAHEPMRSQGTYVDDREIRSVTDFLRTVATPNFERTLVAIKGPGGSCEAGGEGGNSTSSGERDPLFDRAVEIMIETNRGSVSMLQRKMSIGYGRSSRLVDQMAEAGILGESKGASPREVLITMEEWHRMKEIEAEGGNEHLRTVATPNFERTLVAIKGPGGSCEASGEGGNSTSSGECDPLFDRAVEIMIETNRGSVSMLQRKMSIGYGRASRLVDQMAEAGILGEARGASPREVLITMADWDRMKAIEAEGGNELTDEERRLASAVDQESDAFQDSFNDNIPEENK